MQILRKTFSIRKSSLGQNRRYCLSDYFSSLSYFLLILLTLYWWADIFFVPEWIQNYFNGRRSSVPNYIGPASGRRTL